MAVGLSLATLGPLILGFAQDLILYGIGLCISGLAHGLIFPLTASAIASNTPRRLRGLGNAMYLTASDIGFLISPAIISTLLSFTGISQALATLSAAPLIGLLLIWKFHEVIHG